MQSTLRTSRASNLSPVMRLLAPFPLITFYSFSLGISLIIPAKLNLDPFRTIRTNPPLFSLRLNFVSSYTLNNIVEEKSFHGLILNLMLIIDWCWIFHWCIECVDWWCRNEDLIELKPRIRVTRCKLQARLILRKRYNRKNATWKHKFAPT